MIRILKSKLEIEEISIIEFENQLGRTLPYEYREFLLQYNGGMPESNIYEKGEISISIQNFYGLGLDKSEDINYKINVLAERIPKNLLPIAELEGGDVLFIILSEQDFGEIVLWKHEKELEYDFGNDVMPLTRVTKTFSELLDILLPFEPEIEDCFKITKVYIAPEFREEFEKLKNRNGSA